MSRFRSFEEIAADFGGVIESALERFLQFGDGCPPQLADAIRYAVLGPGKRLRPFLVLLACRACGGEVAAALPAACAVELVHAYSLVHDDLPAMDNDDFRRGRPTCHKVFGEGLAILVGDALLARAFEILAENISPPALAAQCCATLARAAGAENLVGGQADDLAATGWLGAPASGSQAVSGQLSSDGYSGQFERSGKPTKGTADLGPEELRRWVSSIHRRKTAAMISASVRLGGLVAGASDQQLAALQTYGEKLGLAFQIVDDILDTLGKKADIGKTPGKDQKQGKLTYPAVFGVEVSRQHASALIAEACQALEPFGPQAADLISVARFVLERQR